MGNIEPSDDGQTSYNASSVAHATWRSLPLTKQGLHTGFSQGHQFQDTSVEANDDFFTTADVSMNGGITRSFEEAAGPLSQFCEQSLAVHNPIPTSQLGSASLGQSVTSSADTSFMTTSSKSSTAPQPIPCQLSDLEDIPSAAQVLKLMPQTITVNLIAGIISIAQPRNVTTRWGHTLSLIEVLLGDDTKSGFGVTFWLSSDNIPESQLSKLRRQDVVLIRNVALHVFRNKVYGQSLRRGLTQINLLWRRDGSGQYSTRTLAKRGSSEHPQMEKTKRVKDWALDFVGGDRPSTRKTPRKSWDQPSG